MRARRCSIKAMTWKRDEPGQPDYYIPPRTRCLYSVLLMHRRKDLWGPDGTWRFVFLPQVPSQHRLLTTYDTWRSTVVRPGAVHRRARAEVPRPEPVHFPPLQRRPAHLPRPAGMSELLHLLIVTPDHAVDAVRSSRTTRSRSCSCASCSDSHPSSLDRTRTPNLCPRLVWSGARMRSTGSSACGCGATLRRMRR